MRGVGAHTGRRRGGLHRPGCLKEPPESRCTFQVLPGNRPRSLRTTTQPPRDMPELPSCPHVLCPSPKQKWSLDTPKGGAPTGSWTGPPPSLVSACSACSPLHALPEGHPSAAGQTGGPPPPPPRPVSQHLPGLLSFWDAPAVQLTQTLLLDTC